MGVGDGVGVLVGVGEGVIDGVGVWLAVGVIVGMPPVTIISPDIPTPPGPPCTEQ